MEDISWITHSLFRISREKSENKKDVHIKIYYYTKSFKVEDKFYITQHHPEPSLGGTIVFLQKLQLHYYYSMVGSPIFINNIVYILLFALYLEHYVGETSIMIQTFQDNSTLL